MRQFGDPSEVSPDQRHCELAGIFATGVLRLRQHRLRVGEPAATAPKTLAKSVATCLEVPDETVLSVHKG